MNFCQKHQNHHCIHAHECKNPEHKKHVEKKSLQQHNKTINHHQQARKSSQNCTFTKGISQKSSKQANNQLLKLLHDKEIRICELEHSELAIKEQYDKLLQQNKHLYTQIEYYRQQFASLIENNQQDNKNQIKKRIKETTNLALKLNSLQSQNQTLLLENSKLKSQLEAQRSNTCQNKHVNQNIRQKYDILHARLKIIDKEKVQFQEQIHGKAKEYQRLKQNYEILKKQFNHDCQKSKHLIKQLTLELELTKKQLLKIKNSSEKQKEILKIEIDNHLKRQNILKQKITSFQLNNKEMFNTIKELKEKNQELEENLYHAKKIIDKSQQQNYEYSNLQKELNQKNIETNTIIKERHSYSSNKQNKQTVKDSEEVESLKEEIKALKQKIIELQKRNMTNYEEIILTMGASEAFKKLLDQKNTTIKKLMREKGQIYAKVTAQYQH